MSDFFSLTKKDTSKKNKVSSESVEQINNNNFFTITNKKDDNIAYIERDKKDIADYDYEDLDEPSLKEDLGYAFKLGLLDTTRGISQLTGIGFDKDQMRVEQNELIQRMQGENGGVVKAAYFAGALLDPATWLIPFAKAKTLYQMGKYGMVSGAIAGAAGYVDEEQNSILTKGKMTRKEQALFGSIGGGILSPALGALKNLGVKVTGKGRITPIGTPDPEGFVGRIFNLKQGDPNRAVKKGYTKIQLEGKAIDEEGTLTKGGRKRIIKKEKDRTMFVRDEVDDAARPIVETRIKKDLNLLKKVQPRKGMYLFGPQSFASRYVFKPYEEKIGRPLYNKITTSGEAGSALAGGVLGFNVDQEAPILDFNRPFTSRLGNAVTGALMGLLGFKGLKSMKKETVVGKGLQGEEKRVMRPMTEIAGRAFLDKYNMPLDMKKARISSQGEGGRIHSQFMDLAFRAKALKVDEQKVFHNMLEAEDLAKVPKSKAQIIVKEARDLIQGLGQKYVDLGLIDRKTFRKNAAVYLRRIYDRDEDIPKIGDELRVRGDLTRVTIDNYLKKKRFEKAYDDNNNLIMVRGGLDDKLPNGRIPMVPHRGWELPPGVTVKDLKDKKKIEELKKRNIIDEDDTIEVRWELTKAQRLAKGEIEDLAAAIELTGQYMASTISRYSFYDDLFKTPNLSPYVKTQTKTGTRYVLDKKYKGLSEKEMLDKHNLIKMPDSNLAEVGAKRYGKLAGKYVMKEVHDNLLEAESYRQAKSNSELFQFNRRLNRIWKASKTAWNPTVHVNNIFGNLALSDFADVPMFKGIDGSSFPLIRAAKLLSEHRDPVKGVKSATVYTAHKYGVFDADFITRELKTFDFDAIKDIYRYDPNQANWLNAHSMAKRAYDAVRKNKITSTLEEWYIFEDHVFRLNAFIHRKQLGDSDADAAMFARKQFIDYDIQAPVINTLRHTVTPFLSFTYRIVPLLAETAIVRPWKFAKYAALGYALNKTGELLGGGEPEKERQLLPKTVAGNILGVPILPHKEIKLPFQSEDGSSKYINIQRLFPGGDVFDLGTGGFLAPAPLQPSFGFIGDAFFSLAGIDLFTRKIDDTRGVSVIEDAKSSVKSLGQKLIPNFPFLPGSYATKRIERAQPGRTEISPFREPESELQAILNAFGIKITNRSLRTLSVGKKAEFDKIVSKLNKDKDKLAKQFASGEITAAEFEDKIADIVMKIQEQAMIFGGRLEGIDPATIKQSPEMIDLMNSR